MALPVKIENYPGFIAISGAALAAKMQEQAVALGAEIVTGEVVKISRSAGKSSSSPEFEVVTRSLEKYKARTVIVATGMERRKLGVPGEEEYFGKGVAYCATCDAPLFKGKTVGIVGAGNAAAHGALLLADLAEKVYLICRRDSLLADPIFVSRIKEQVEQGRVELIGGTTVREVKGDGKKVTAVSLDRPVVGRDELALDGIFIEVGGVPGTALVRPLGVELDESGFIRVDLEMGTNVPGLFAAGDITSSGSLLQQIVTACAQGATAAASAYKFVKGEKAVSPLHGC